MLVLKTGPATRRPGTQFIAPCKVIPGGNYCARLEEFQFSINTTFVIEWGHHYVRFFSNGAQVIVALAPLWVNSFTSHYYPGDFVEDPTDGNAIYYCISEVASSAVPPHLDPGKWVKQNIYERPTPYSAYVGTGTLPETEVFQLAFCPINDVIYVCHKAHPRAKLTRFGDTQWVYEEVLDLTPALLDQNASDTTISADAATGTTHLAANAPAWANGAYYEVGASVRAPVGAGLFVVGYTYTIVTVGTTDFTLIGASANTIGVTFVATGVGAGNGVASALFVCVFPNVGGIFANDLAAGYWQQQIIFQPGHVGAFWELAYLRGSAYVEYDGVAATGFAVGASASITAFGAWAVNTYGVWSADIAIQSSTDGGTTWQTVRTITGRGDRNAAITGDAVRAQLYRILVSNVAVPATPGATNPRIVFECVDAFLFGIVQITSVQDGYHATANVITQLTVADTWVSSRPYAQGDRVGYLGINYLALNDVTSATTPLADPTNWVADGWPTIYWSEGAWSDVRGYPRAITVFEQRVWCGFTEFEPQKIWGTRTGELENWDLGDQTLATDGVAFALDAVGDGAIVWLQTQEALFVGMVQAEWIVARADFSASIGPNNVTAHRQSRWGSNENIPAVVVGDALVFAQRQAFSLRQMLFSVITNKYMSQDLTALSDQVLNGGALQMAYQKQGNKNGFLWATTANGEIVAMTYELDQEIFGWHRHYTGLGIDAGFESVCTIQGKGTADDEVWVVVNRTIGGERARFVERINPVNWQTIVPQPGQTPGYGADKDRAYYVDFGRTITVVLETSAIFSGFDYLEGRTVAGSANGQDLGTAVVSGGEADFTNSGYEPVPGDLVHIGLPFLSILQPMNLDVDVHTGVTQGMKKKVTGLFINLLNTLACICTDGSFRVYVNDGKLIVGVTYTIVSAGTTNFVALGAANNLVGTTFVATGTGDGSGTGRVGSQPRQNELTFRKASAPLGEVPLFTGVFEVRDFAGDYGLSIPVIFRTQGPLPMTVCGVAIAYNLSGTP